MPVRLYTAKQRLVIPPTNQNHHIHHEKLNHIGIFLVYLFITIQSFASEPIRVACIGNSITYGAFIPNREMNCYPAQLQAYLGDGYEVKNFGASGRTILSKGDYPYSETDTYKASLEYQPDIVLIKLGTNDTKPQNWKYKNEFKDNYQTLIDTYRNLKSHPRIILLTPIRCFLPEGSEINAQLIENEVRPTVEELAWKINWKLSICLISSATSGIRLCYRTNCTPLLSEQESWPKRYMNISL